MRPAFSRRRQSVPERSSFDYAVLRIVPRVDREEFINAGLILHCLTRNYLQTRVHLDEQLVLALRPDFDLEETARHLDALVKISAGEADSGPIAALPKRQRFHWLVSPRSTIIQVSPVHCGLCESPSEAFEELYARLVLR